MSDPSWQKSPTTRTSIQLSTLLLLLILVPGHCVATQDCGVASLGVYSEFPIMGGKSIEIAQAIGGNRHVNEALDDRETLDCRLHNLLRSRSPRFTLKVLFVKRFSRCHKCDHQCRQ